VKVGVLDIVKPGVLNGSEANKLFAYAKENKFAIPAVNVVSTDSVNSVLEAAKKNKLSYYCTVFQWGCELFWWKRH
jgi:fructose/tagatose bisphosphate aldolase